MTWDPVVLMTAFDIVVVATGATSLLVLHRQSPVLAQLGLLTAARVLAAGILAIGLFYVADLFAMWGLPFFVPSPRAMAFMEVLHRNYTWGLMLAIAGCVGIGTYLMRGALRETTQLTHRIEGLEQTDRSLVLTQLAVDRGADPMYWIQENGRIRYANDAARRVLGYSRAELLSMRVSDLDPDYPADTWPEHWQRMREAGSLCFEGHHETKAGKVFPVEIRASFFQSEGNEYVWAYVHDITDRVEARDTIVELNRILEQRVDQRTAEVGAAQEELQRVFDLSVDMICVATLEGQFRRVNPAFGKTLGYAEEELLAKPYLEFVHPDDREATLDVMREKLDAGEEVLCFENRYRHKDGSYRWLRWTSRPVVEDGVTYATAKDVTEEKLAAEELLRHRDHLAELVAENTAELSQSEKTLRALTARVQQVREEERTVLARELHDELGQALTCVNIDLGWMAQKLEGGDPALRERVGASMELVAETIGAVQRISSDLRPPALDDLGLFEATRWYVEAFAQRSGLAARVDLPENAPDLGTEATTAVFRVLQEALTNVARHANASEVRVAVDSSGDALRVRVIDDGCGIPPDKVADNLSLGLLGMKERAAAFGGAVHVMRRREAGTEVLLTVPLGPNTGSTPE